MTREQAPAGAHPFTSSADPLPHVSTESWTPGPWEVWTSLYEGFGAAVVCNVEPLKIIAEVRDYRDALLLASAPSLYVALQLILPLAKGYAPEGQSEQAKRTCRSWIEAADAALALARGEALRTDKTDAG